MQGKKWYPANGVSYSSRHPPLRTSHLQTQFNHITVTEYFLWPKHIRFSKKADELLVWSWKKTLLQNHAKLLFTWIRNLSCSYYNNWSLLTRRIDDQLGECILNSDHKQERIRCSQWEGQCCWIWEASGRTYSTTHWNTPKRIPVQLPSTQ